MRRALAALAAAAVAAPALAYLLPPPAILKRLAARREDQGLASLEVRGTLVVTGSGAAAASAALGLPLAGGDLVSTAILSLRVPGLCRLELAPPDVPDAERPFLVSRQGRLQGRGLDRVPAAAALLDAVCALLAERPAGPEPDCAYAAQLGRLGVVFGDTYLGRIEGRVAYVLGSRPSERKPQLWVDKHAFQPVRLLTLRGGTAADVRLVDWGSPVGGDWFPRAVEVHGGSGLEARLTAEKVAANPRLADSLF